MVRVRCLLKPSNDAAMLQAWLRYHAYLFGFEALSVDEGSEDAGVPAVLGTARAAGAVIGSTLDEEPHVEIACDEFLAVFTTNGLTCRPAAVGAAVAAGRAPARISPSLFSVDGAANEFAVSSAGQPKAPALTCLSFRGEPPPGSAPRVHYQGLANLLDALGIQASRFGSPVRTPRDAPHETVWRRLPDGGAQRVTAGGGGPLWFHSPV